MGYDKNKTTRPNLDKVIHAMWQMGGGKKVALFIDPPRRPLVVLQWRPPASSYPTPLAMLAMFCQMTSAPNTNEHNGCGCVEEATVVVLASCQRRRSKKSKTAETAVSSCRSGAIRAHEPLEAETPRTRTHTRNRGMTLGFWRPREPCPLPSCRRGLRCFSKNATRGAMGF
jgi:hypothetical protein